MELFNEVKNKYFYLVFKILILSQKGLKEEEIIKIVDNEEYEEKLIGKDFKTFEGLLLNKYSKEENFNFLKEEKGNFYPIINEKENVLPVRFTLIEKIWLKEFVNNNVVKDLLGENIIKKLEVELKNVEYFNIEEMLDITNISKSTKRFENKFNKVFFEIIDAIVNNRTIYYSNKDKDGNNYKDELGMPIRIEYSNRNCGFSVNIYNLKENRNILVNLNSIYNIKSAENINFNITREEIIEKIKKERYCEEPLIVELEDKRGAIERFFMSFSQYERSSRYLGNNKYEIKINYYTFEEYEVINKIVSLGPVIKVISPIAVKNKVIMQVVKALELCKE